MRKIRVGSRESKLAVIQSQIIIDKIKEKHPDIEIELITMKTSGDKILDKTLDKVGGKGLFVKELDRALLENEVDITVHSLKDVPMVVDPEIPLIGFTKSKDPHDVLVLPKGVKEVDFTKPVGSSSMRRSIQFKRMYPNADIKPVRGNVLTRLEKLDRGEYSALILAAAGLKRLGLEDRISRVFTIDEMIPAAGQGVIAIQGRAGENYDFLEGVIDDISTICVEAERNFVRILDGGCSSPIAAHARIEGDKIKITGLFANDKTVIIKTKEGLIEDRMAISEKLALDMKKGRVTLVGAGPGDVGLLTIKGYEAIKNAEVIVYDRLVSEDILKLIPESAELINAGKESSNHRIPQEKINQILLDKALEGKNVVRLKGGDPFLFGRGGEELELLAKNNIDFEVVPGITSALSVPAYAGIPVTHRDYVSSVHIITGHQKKNEPVKIDFDNCVKAKGTLVFLMGVSNMSLIMDGLISHGMDKDMPAAVIESGTRPEQRKLIATVATITAEAKKAKIKSPAIILVGQVAGLSNDFDWFSNLPLKGKEIVVTRPKERAGRLTDILKGLGANVSSCPCISTNSILDDTLFDEISKSLSDYRWLVFTSPAGVKAFFDKLSDLRKDARLLANCKIAVIGKATGEEVAKYGIFPDLMPAKYSGRDLGQLLTKTLSEADKVLLLRAKEGAKEIVDELKTAGISYKDIAIYETDYSLDKELADSLANKINSDEIDYITFTSSSTVQAFVQVVKADYNRFIAVCIGDKTNETAKAAGMRTIVSKQATVDSLADAIKENEGR